MTEESREVIVETKKKYIGLPSRNIPLQNSYFKLESTLNSFDTAKSRAALIDSTLDEEVD
jgi:hypothetical protein